VTVRLNGGWTYAHRVGVQDSGEPLLAHLASRFPHADEAAWRVHLEAGRVSVNGSPASEDRVLRAGDLVEYRRAPWEEPSIDVPVPAVFEDEHVLVVDKPAGLQVLPAGSRLQATVLAVVRGDDPARAEWSPVHRLGRGTSGLLVIGKTSLARSSLSAQFRERRLGKLYLAWVTGTLPDSLRIREPIGPVDHPRGVVHSVAARGKPALTLVRTLRRDAERGMSLVAAEPVTGRPDQIRIHLAFAGAPLVGDPLYAPGAALLDARPGDVGYLLHATSLRFRHPATGAWMRVRCMPPWTPAELDGARFLDILRRRGMG
jgi:23S rRNA pseudouridine1911/1915/1917 synthase